MLILHRVVLLKENSRNRKKAHGTAKITTCIGMLPVKVAPE